MNTSNNIHFESNDSLEVIEMIHETTNLINDEPSIISSSVVSGAIANDLSENIFLGKRLFRFGNNFGNIKGHSYEMDFAKYKRLDPRNVFYKIKPNSNPHQEGYDIVRTSIFTKKKTYYELKAGRYFRVRPNKNTVLVSTSETKARGIGFFKRREAFKNQSLVNKRANQLSRRIESNKLPFKFTVGNMAKASFKSAAVGFTIAITAETLSKYRDFKKGLITKDDYLKSVMTKGSKVGIASFATTSAMIPITAFLTFTGITSLIIFPVSFILGGEVYKQVEKTISSQKIPVIKFIKKEKIQRYLGLAKKDEIIK